MPFFQVNELGLKAQLSDLFRHSFKHTISFLISFPLTMGEGWDGGGHRGSSPPHLDPPPPWGEEVIFLTQLRYNVVFRTSLQNGLRKITLNYQRKWIKGATYNLRSPQSKGLNQSSFHIRRKLNLPFCDNLRENNLSPPRLYPLKGAGQGCFFGVKAKNHLMVFAKLDPSNHA